MWDWFIDNKLSIQFRQDKAKSILLATKHKLRKAKSLDIVYNGIEIKPHTKEKYLGCILDEINGRKSCVSMALIVINKVNSCFTFLHRQNRFCNTPFT